MTTNNPARPYFKWDRTDRPDKDKRPQSIIRSYLLVRSAIGILGILLPLVLLLGDWWLLSGSASARGSLSAYYHSGMRDYFVGTLVIVGFALVIYKFYQLSLDNLITFVGGFAALVVAFFPTGLPSTGGTLTPLQDRLGEGAVEFVHYAGAGTLFAVLVLLSWRFGKVEAERKDPRPRLRRGPHPDARQRGWFHWGCAAVVTAAILFIVITRFASVFGSQDMLLGESVALIAFGLSWAYKGLEWDTLFARAGSGSTAASPAAPAPKEGQRPPNLGPKVTP
ncbi:MAG: hypothetical protein HY875_03605 [Chloroflexi bacterium]|nr:hypothetical protein [Chloroflexota bacterium]